MEKSAIRMSIGTIDCEDVKEVVGNILRTNESIPREFTIPTLNVEGNTLKDKRQKAHEILDYFFDSLESTETEDQSCSKG